jgi:hypothetical protein
MQMQKFVVAIGWVVFGLGAPSLDAAEKHSPQHSNCIYYKDSGNKGSAGTLALCKACMDEQNRKAQAKERTARLVEQARMMKLEVARAEQVREMERQEQVRVAALEKKKLEREAAENASRNSSGNYGIIIEAIER